MVDDIENESEEELRQRGLENFILLVLGMVDNKISLLHLEKEVFLLWNFHPQIKQYLTFIKHFRGPFSKEIQESILNPFYLDDYWMYIPPKKGDNLSGGYIELTNLGKKEYKRLVNKIREDDDLLHLLAGIKTVRELYDKLTKEELLLLIYDTFPVYIEKSKVYKDIESKKAKLAESLLNKGFIDLERYNSLLSGS
ncbi:MAG: hypothetical protein WCE94_01255 [Candidatus Methanoperedens sp.]